MNNAIAFLFTCFGLIGIALLVYALINNPWRKYNDVTDKELIRVYNKGWDDELKGVDISKYFTNPLRLRAYKLGQMDALAGDDVLSVDLQTIPDILKKIKQSK